MKYNEEQSSKQEKKTEPNMEDKPDKVAENQLQVYEDEKSVY